MEFSANQRKPISTSESTLGTVPRDSYGNFCRPMKTRHMDFERPTLFGRESTLGVVLRNVYSGLQYVAKNLQFRLLWLTVYLQLCLQWFTARMLNCLNGLQYIFQSGSQWLTERLSEWSTVSYGTLVKVVYNGSGYTDQSSFQWLTVHFSNLLT